jgi:hypothetical protein
MNNQRKYVVSVLAASGILTILAFGVVQTTRASSDNRVEKLRGSWNVEVTTPTQGTFLALLTFITDGSVIADESPTPSESTGHGSWVGTGNRAAAYTFVATLAITTTLGRSNL